MSTVTKNPVVMRNLFEQVKFVPHSPEQWQVCESDSRFNIIICGRRWGKSQAAGHRLTHKSFVPDSYNWIVAPTYKLGEKEFRVVFGDYQKMGLLDKCRKSYSVKQGDMRIKTPWNSVVEVVSAEKPDSLVGEGLDHACMSEAAIHPRNVWEQYIEPALSDKRGSADFPTTPRGYNWMHGMYIMGQAAEHPQYRSWQLPTWLNTVRFPLGKNDPEIIRLKSTTSKTYFDQEYGAQFTSFSGQIYDEWDDRIHIARTEYNPSWPNYLVFDYGFANPTVALDIMVDPYDRMYVWREYYSRYKSTFEHGNYLHNERPNPEGYHVDGLFGDPRGADEAATLALTLGYVDSPIVPWKHGIEAIKRRLKVDIDGKPKLFVDDRCINTIREISQLHVSERANRGLVNINERTGDGNIQHKVDDHAADALRYFVGPYDVLGAGAHLSDIYDSAYRGSESEDFLRLHTGVKLTDDFF